MKFTGSLKNKFLHYYTKISNETLIYLLSFGLGIAAGIAAIVLKYSVHFIRNMLEFGLNEEYSNILYLVYPAVGILITLVFIKYILRRKIGDGIPGLLYAISQNGGIIKKYHMFSSIVASAFTVGFGGSVGLEGPTVATGGAIGSNVGRIFKLNYKQRILLLGSAGAGAMAAIFKAPIAAVVFALEVIMLDLTMASLVPLLITTTTAALTSYFFLGQDVIYPFELVEKFNLTRVPYYTILGIAAGLLSVYFTKVFMYVDSFFEKIKSIWVRLIFGGFSLGMLIYIFPALYGEGYEVINSAIQGNWEFLFNRSLFYGLHDNAWVIISLFSGLILLKVVASSVTLGAGGIGGIFAPSLFIGANLGLLLAFLLNHLGIADVPYANFAVVGMGAMIAGILHAPLTAIFLIGDLTGGYGLFLPLMITSTLSYATARIFMPHSVYTIQLAAKKQLITHHKDQAALTLMKVEQLLETNFKTVKKTDTLGQLVKTISESQRNIFPVLDDNGYLDGLVILDDIRTIMFQHELYNITYVSDLMIMPADYVTPEDSMEDVAKKIQKTGRFNMVVLKDGKYLGFVSRANVFSEYRKLVKDFSDH